MTEKKKRKTTIFERLSIKSPPKAKKVTAKKKTTVKKSETVRKKKEESIEDSVYKVHRYTSKTRSHIDSHLNALGAGLNVVLESPDKETALDHLRVLQEAASNRGVSLERLRIVVGGKVIYP